MRYDDTKIDEAVLAVLYLTAWEDHGLTRAWKGIDWAVSNRLHERGLIDDPKNKNKSIIFSEEGGCCLTNAWSGRDASELRAMSALRYRALMARSGRMGPAAQAHR